MLIDLTDEQKRAYERLYVSKIDLEHAQFCLSMLSKKRWHSKQFERRGTVYHQQAAYTTAFVISYARPFTKGFGWDALPKNIYSGNEHYVLCHQRVMALRHTVFAHSDRKHFSVRPWVSRLFQTDIVRLPDFRISLEDSVLLRDMLPTLQEELMKRLREIVPESPTSKWAEEDLPFDELEVGESFFVSTEPSS